MKLKKLVIVGKKIEKSEMVFEGFVSVGGSTASRTVTHLPLRKSKTKCQALLFWIIILRFQSDLSCRTTSQGAQPFLGHAATLLGLTLRFSGWNRWLFRSWSPRTRPCDWTTSSIMDYTSIWMDFITHTKISENYIKNEEQEVNRINWCQIDFAVWSDG